MGKYKISDVVTVKTWEEMEKEYGLIYYPEIGSYICLENEVM